MRWLKIFSASVLPIFPLSPPKPVANNTPFYIAYALAFLVVSKVIAPPQVYRRPIPRRCGYVLPFAHLTFLSRYMVDNTVAQPIEMP